MASVTAEHVNSTIRKLVELRRLRENRDYWAFSKAFLDTAEALKKHFGSWTTSELDDLTTQVDLLVPISDGQAREKLINIKHELEDIRERKLDDTKRKLEQFTRDLKKGKYTRTSEVINALVDYVEPSFSVVTKLHSLRGIVDSLADMTVSLGQSLEGITAEEWHDVKASLKEIKEGRAKQGRDVEAVFHDLEA